MAIRIGVLGDTEDECAEGLAQLVDRGYLPVMMPKYLTDGRWHAKAVPQPSVAAAASDAPLGA